MGSTRAVWGAAAAAVSAAVLLAACNQIIGLEKPTLDAQSATGGGGGASTTSGQGAFGGEPVCAPTDPICNQVESDCIALVDNSERTRLGYRMQQITIVKPDALSSGLEYGAVLQSLTMNLEACQLLGGGTVNLLAEIDIETGLARMGVGKPVADPFEGYRFVNEMLEISPGVEVLVEPAVTPVTLVDGVASVDVVPSVNLALYLSQDASSYIVVPLSKGRLFDVHISDDLNCVGSYNAYGLDPDNGCLPDLGQGIKSYIEDAQADGYILLEDADSVEVTAFNLDRTLCAIIAEDLAEFGDFSDSNMTRCKRWPDGSIKYPGDWCSVTDGPATADCHDAALFRFSWAGSAVEIHED